MFEEKDYFMKIVQQFSTAIGRIMGLKAENKIEESQDVLNETLTNFTGLSREVLEVLPYEILIQKVSGSRRTNTEKCLMLAELLSQQADIYEFEGKMSKAKNLYLKSLNIMISVTFDHNDELLEQNREKGSELLKKIGKSELPKESKLLLFKYYENVKDYAKAEDVLFELMDADEVNDDLLAQGTAFYKRLVKREPIELEKGNLPLDEVLEGLANLDEYRNP
ncbi:Hypothetical protein DEACI_2002 [Acididesulfobacillus acetoxydans]|uniref:Tetratricopeptide repeat protein n=1 Tax=Acididesulfobacillus acetoxydans TaxID=1561005 RepID=A0A8S0XBK2_9FIRM|nr:DUF6483 family protein [Acididesulfobacillus acetoxydans]CAA7601336.1 Hypothetical protein DEACI_2002 [Acididesulfobacillus acetoxydans]CEJ09368.1 Hypothetical protein DEACI_3852 [Acididesulfobacillus acetoxydans]